MDYSAIRAQARSGLRDRWAIAIAICLVAQLLGGIMVGSSFLPQITYTYRGEITSLEEAVDALTTLTSQFGGSTVSISALGLAELILGGVLQLGYAGILLKQHTHQPYTFDELFSQFHRFGQGFAQRFLRSLYSFLWGLLFFIPGIIASYRYAMTPFIMADHPELTAREAISRSCELMNGYKLDLFVLRLTFFGWDLLAALTMNIGHLVLNPYKNAAEAAFYRQIAGYPGTTVESH